ncbi:MAG: MotA/TolQ/ExbB proton channel family protein [Proteobacteria bacterium]|nr:MotA/TolQ/ExbB proton channel family protein [Pseudomonadota bacterium]
MEFVLHLFRMYPDIISTLVQGVVYIGSAVLFINALWITIRAHKHIRMINYEKMKATVQKESSMDDPLMIITAKTYYSAHLEHNGNGYSKSFLADATFQLIENLFHTKYVNKITMISNLLPPMGFIGTIFGMIMIFLAKGDPNSDLNTSGLGAALFTTLIALSCFVIIEVLKKNLINLSEVRIDKALGMTSKLF